MLITRRDLLKSVGSFALLPAIPKSLRAFGSEYKPLDVNCLISVWAMKSAFEIEDRSSLIFDDIGSRERPIVEYVSHACGSHAVRTPDIGGLKIFIKCHQAPVERTARRNRQTVFTNIAVINGKQILDQTRFEAYPNETECSHLMSAGGYNFVIKLTHERAKQ